MNKKKRLLDLFTQDVEYNYHLIRTIDPNGHLLYVKKNDSPLEQDSLEFAPTVIIEELFKDCSVESEKFTPGIFWTKEFDTEELKNNLNKKFSEEPDFSNFIESIREEYRILEVQDSLLYKKDPEAYAQARREEYTEHQRELMGDYIKQHQDSKNQREEALLAYNNNLINLLKDYFEGVIEFEKRDFDFNAELDKIVGSLVDTETWIKVDDKPFICRIEISELFENRMKVYLTNNEDYSFSAILRFEKTQLITEDVVRIDESITCPRIMTDYDVLVQLFDIDTKSIPEWDYKNEDDRFEFVIDYLIPLFKEAKKKRNEDYLNKLKKEEESEEELEDFEHAFDDDYSGVEGLEELVINNLDEHNAKFKNMNSNAKLTTPSDWYFDILVPPEEEKEYGLPTIIALSEDGSDCLDDQLGSHSLSQNVIDALNRAGIFGDSEMMEAMWEVVDSETKTKEEIIESMKKEGFIYTPNMLGH